MTLLLCWNSSALEGIVCIQQAIEFQALSSICEVPNLPRIRSHRSDPARRRDTGEAGRVCGPGPSRRYQIRTEPGLKGFAC